MQAANAALQGELVAVLLSISYPTLPLERHARVQAANAALQGELDAALLAAAGLEGTASGQARILGGLRAALARLQGDKHRADAAAAEARAALAHVATSERARAGSAERRASRALAALDAKACRPRPASDEHLCKPTLSW